MIGPTARNLAALGKTLDVLARTEEELEVLRDLETGIERAVMSARVGHLTEPVAVEYVAASDVEQEIVRLALIQCLEYRRGEILLSLRRIGLDPEA